MGSLYLGGPTIQEVDGKMMMGLSIYFFSSTTSLTPLVVYVRHWSKLGSILVNLP